MVMHFPLDLSGHMPLPHHPQYHRRQQERSDKHRRSLEDFLSLPDKSTCENMEEKRRKDACCDPGSNTEVDAFLILMIIGLVQVRKHDPHDEACFQRFPGRY